MNFFSTFGNSWTFVVRGKLDYRALLLMPHTRNNLSVPETAQYTPSLVKDQCGNFPKSLQTLDANRVGLLLLPQLN